MLMILFTSGVGGVFLVIAWAKLMAEPPARVSPKHSLALYSFTASVCVVTLGALVGLAFIGEPRMTTWVISLLIGFACVAASVVNGRQASGPGTGALKIGGLIVFLADLVGFIGMIMSLPGMPLNKG